jgi:hypothetical protein
VQSTPLGQAFQATLPRYQQPAANYLDATCYQQRLLQRILAVLLKQGL